MNKSKLRLALAACKKSFYYVGIFSCFINVLMLTIPLYMLQVFDRVLSSQSYDTLVFLTIIAIFALLVLSFLDALRSRVLIKVSHWLDNQLSPFAFAKSTEICLKDTRYTRQSLRDVASVRDFLCGNDIISLFDAPWTFIYLIVIYMLHPLLGIIATCGVVILLIISVINEYATRNVVKEANQHNMQTQMIVDSTLANAESVQAMGMLNNVIRRWFDSNEKALAEQSKASVRSTSLLSAAKFFRMVLQISILGTGAYLVVHTGTGLQGTIFTAGGMIAASILTSRAMAPVERAIGTWKKFIIVRQAFARVDQFLQATNPHEKAPFLTDPKGKLIIENMFYRPQGVDHPILKGVNFQVEPGDSLAIVGPSGAGKSTLARLMLGIWEATSGRVTLDGCDVVNIEREDFGHHVGYCPQEVRLFQGTVMENIARMGEPNEETVVEATKFVGAHEMILGLPQGYNTVVSPYSLSGGQQQRIALARALYNKPTFVVLDEPNSNLDEEGVQALMRTVLASKEHSMTMILITHQTKFLQVVDKVMVLNGGVIQAYGPREQVLGHLQQNAQQQSQQSSTQRGNDA